MYESSDDSIINNSQFLNDGLIRENISDYRTGSITTINSFRSRMNQLDCPIHFNQKYLAFSLVSKCIMLPFKKAIPLNFTIYYKKLTIKELSLIKRECKKIIHDPSEDGLFVDFVKDFYRRILKPNYIRIMVDSGICSYFDFDELIKIIFHKNSGNWNFVEKLIKLISLNPENVKGIVEEAEKGEIYDEFNNLLDLSTYESKSMYNILKLDNIDEQIEEFQREIECRILNLENISQSKNYDMFVMQGEMEPIFEENERANIDFLCKNLEIILSDNKTNLRSKKIEFSGDIAPTKLKNSYIVTVFVMNVKDLPESVTKQVYCEVLLKNSKKLKTHKVDPANPKWNSYCEFSSTKTVSLLKVKLCQASVINKNVIGKIQTTLTPFQKSGAKWYTLVDNHQVSLRLIINVYRPSNIQFGGFLVKYVKKKPPKKYYFMIIRVETDSYILSGYEENRSSPSDYFNLDGYIVDYCLNNPDEFVFKNEFCFYILKEGSSIFFSAENEEDLKNWVTLISKATGQNYVPSMFIERKTSAALLNNIVIYSESKKQLQIAVDACDRHYFFKKLHRLILVKRLNEDIVTLGRLSPIHNFILYNYCLRYCIETSSKNLAYLENYIAIMEQSMTIDISLVFDVYAELIDYFIVDNNFLISHAILVSERDLFIKLQSRLIFLLEHQLTNFRCVFPFGRPEGGMAKTLKFYTSLCSEGFAVPSKNETQVYALVTDIIQNSSTLTYNLIKNKIKVEETDFARIVFKNTNWSKWFVGVVKISKECVSLYEDIMDFYMNQSHECDKFIIECANRVWRFLLSDLKICLNHRPPEDWSCWDYFIKINEYFYSNDVIFLHSVHREFANCFAGLFDKYMENTIARLESMQLNIMKDPNLMNRETGCIIVDVTVGEIKSLLNFLESLKWPDKNFVEEETLKIKKKSTMIIKKLSEKLYDYLSLTLRESSSSCMLSDLIITILNSIVFIKNENQIHLLDDDFFDSIIINGGTLVIDMKLICVLNDVLSKLGKYSSMISPLLGILKIERNLGEEYVQFVEANSEKLKLEIKDDLACIEILKMWMETSLKTINDWFEERKEVTCHPEQLRNISIICKKTRKVFEMRGVKHVSCIMYEEIWKRIHIDQMKSIIKNEDKNENKVIQAINKLKNRKNGV